MIGLVVKITIKKSDIGGNSKYNLFPTLCWRHQSEQINIFYYSYIYRLDEVLKRSPLNRTVFFFYLRKKNSGWVGCKKGTRKIKDTKKYDT